jgi:hypothetical protein
MRTETHVTKKPMRRKNDHVPEVLHDLRRSQWLEDEA